MTLAGMLASTSGSAVLRGPAPFRSQQRQSGRMLRTRVPLAVRSEEGNDDSDFDARLAALKTAKGQTPRGQGKKKGSNPIKAAAAAAAQGNYDFSEETVWLETPPAYGDLAVNVALGATLLWLPLTFAAIGRTAFVRYRFTDKRISVITSAPWDNKQLDAAYQEVVDVKAIGRGVGLWGDMVVELRNGSKVEMRAVPRWQEVRDYINERTASLKANEAAAPKKSDSAAKGFA